MDTAYLNTNLDAEIFITQPKGFEIASNQGEHLVCELKKAIYGLKQAGLGWYNHLTKLLNEMGFIKSDSDQCLFVKKSENVILVTTYVDDIIVASQSIEDIKKFEPDL